MNARELTPLGRLLEAARTEVLRISGREAARRANITEARWRQVVTGVQSRAGVRVPVRPKAITVVAMALAVQIDPAEALAAAGMARTSADVAALVEETRRDAAAQGAAQTAGDELAAEIERIRNLPISVKARRQMIDVVVSLFEEEAAQAAQTRKGDKQRSA